MTSTTVERRVKPGVGVRDPRASTQKVGWTSPGLPQVMEWDAEQAFRLGYLANVIAYRCVQIIANTIAAIPIVAGKSQRKPNNVNENSPLSKFFGPPPGGPAPKLSATKLIRWTVAQQIVTGRRAWEIETANGQPDGTPVAFWPLVAANLAAVPSTSGTEWFRLFRYGDPHRPVIMQPGNVFYGWQPGGLDFRQPETGLQAARYDLSLVTLCDRYGLGFLQNNAVPAAIVTTTAFPNDEARRKFMSNWTSEFGGPSNAGRVALNEVGDDGDGPVGESIDVKVLGLSAKDSRLIETRKDAMAEVAISLGMPWSRLDASGRTFDNASQEAKNFYQDTILPLLTDLQDDINMQIAPRLGTDVCWFDLSNIEALKRKVFPVTEPATVVQLTQGQLMWLNEARADYGLEPLPDGDRMMTAQEIAALKPGPAAAAVVTGAAVPLDANGEQLALPPAKTEVPAPPPAPAPARAKRTETRAKDLEAVELRRSSTWRSTDAVAATIEARWQRAFKRLFTKQETAALARLTGKRGRQATRDAAPQQDPSHLFDKGFWTEETTQVASDLYEQAVSAGLERVSSTFGVSFDLEQPGIARFILDRAKQLAGFVTDTTYEQIRTAMVEGVTDGESIEDIAKRITDVFHEATTSRALTIARTEVISAYNGAQQLGAAQLPDDVVAGSEWIATRDSRTREAHAEVDGQQIRKGGKFMVGGAEMEYPGDPAGGSANTVNCRCAIGFLTPDDFAERGAAVVETRTAKALIGLVSLDGFDLLAFRRALEGVAA